MGMRRSRHRRLRKSKVKQGRNDGGDASCPPHPGFVRGLCIRCGAKEEDAAEGGAPRVGGVFFLDGAMDGCAEGGAVGKIQEVPAAVPASAAAAASIPRASDLEALLRARKLTLILDLDHTLLNSTGLDDFSSMEARNGFTPNTMDDPAAGLFRLDTYGVPVLTKLRPFARGFLEQASAMFEMYVYTLGGQDYARASVKLLDPDGVYFGGGGAARVVSSEESTRQDRKSLDVIPGAEATAVVILDDSDFVWPEHGKNLIRVDRYIYFASSCRQFGYGGVSSLAERRRDERDHDGALAVMLGVLKRVHQGFFDSVLDGHCSDVREVIGAVRREVLRGCTVAFSRVIPLEGVAGEHPMWKMAEQMGAVCAASADDTVTHVVALDPGTEKARWARDNRKFLVNPKWIRAASFRWCRPNEQDFPVTRGR
ncbi:unnamed protein product [Urochloa humidicola]